MREQVADPEMLTPLGDAPSEEDRRRFARRWHDELREEIRSAQERRELVLRWSLPVIFAAVASSASSDSPTASEALWHLLAGGVVLLVAVETTLRLSRDVIWAGARNERLERFDLTLAPNERAVHEPAKERWQAGRLPGWLKPYWPRPGRSRVLTAWYALASLGLLLYWLLAVSSASLEQTLVALALPTLALIGCLRLLLSGRLHWQREELLEGDRLLTWVERGIQPDDLVWRDGRDGGRSEG